MRIKKRPILYFALAAFVVLVASSSGVAQSTEGAAIEVKPYPCEYNISTLSAAHNAAGPKGLIIAIARLGDGEYSREFNRRRLHNVRIYLTEFDWHRTPDTVITAEGERVRGYGRIELYVNGKLFEVLATKRNRDLLVGSCEPDDERPVKAESNLYPYLDRRGLRSTKKQ
jgi:hypothetical protein